MEQTLNLIAQTQLEFIRELVKTGKIIQLEKIAYLLIEDNINIENKT
jgi:hypothetical protein